MLCTIFAVSAFLLLRKDRPAWPRPIRLSRGWLPIAWIVLVTDIAVTAVGASHPQEAGYGSVRNVLIAIAVLLVSLVLYVIRRVGQDHQPLALREPSEPALPAPSQAPGAPDCGVTLENP